MSKKGRGNLLTEQFCQDKKLKISEIRYIDITLRDEMEALKNELSNTKQEVKEGKIVNEKMEQSIISNIYKLNELEQNGRRENL